MAARYIHYGEDTLAMCRSTKRQAIITMDVERVTCGVCIDHLASGIPLHRDKMNHLAEVHAPDNSDIPHTQKDVFDDRLSRPRTGEITVYTDGAASPNPGLGGYGAVILGLPNRTEPLEICQGFRLTTNNRMEIMAVVAGLEATPKGSRVTVYSDSQYVVNAVSKGWAKRWQAKDWMRNGKEPALNPDLWERLLNLADERSVNLQWVRGHAGNQGNERADALAVMASQGSGLPEDQGYQAVDAKQSPVPQESSWQPAAKGGYWFRQGDFNLTLKQFNNSSDWSGAIHHQPNGQKKIGWLNLGSDLDVAKRALECEMESLLSDGSAPR